MAKEADGTLLALGAAAFEAASSDTVAHLVSRPCGDVELYPEHVAVRRSVKAGYTAKIMMTVWPPDGDAQQPQVVHVFLDADDVVTLQNQLAKAT